MRNSISIYGRSPLWNWMAGDIEDFFDRNLSLDADQAPHRVVPYEAKETEAGYLMSLDLPGIRKEDLKIEVVDQTLTVAGERKREDGNGTKILHRFTIPASADISKIEANLENGVLEIALPKVEAAKARTIQIQSGSPSVFSKLLGSSKKDKAHEKTVQVS